MPSGFDFQALENVIAQVVASAAGLPTGKVIWEGQTCPRPALPYASLWRDAEECLSFTTEQWQEANPSGVVGDPDATPPTIGTELLLNHRVPAEFQLRVQVFTSAVRGNSAAHALLGNVHNAFHLESVKAKFEAVGAVVVDPGTIQNLTGLVETKIEGRASLDVRIRFVESFGETATYIESVEVTPTIDGVEGNPFNAP